MNKKIEKKMLLHTVSITFLLYFFFGIDRGNVGFAALQMNAALGMSSEVYGYGSGLFTMAYLLFQVPNAGWLRRLGASRGFAVVAFAWGLVSTSTAFVPSPALFLVNRFLLGFSEAGFHAFLIFYINQMFPGSIRGFAVGVTFAAIPLSMIVASPLSGWLLTLQTAHLQGWQTLFIVEGVPSMLLSLVCLKFIPDNPGRIRYLTEEEKAWLEQELDKDTEPGSERAGAEAGLKEGLSNPLVWGLSYILFSMLVAVNVMLIWMPQMIRLVSGAGSLEVGILNSIPWLVFGVGTLVFSRLSDRIRNRITPLLASIAIAAVGFTWAALFQDAHPQFAFCGFLLAAFSAGAAQGVFWALTMQMITGPSAAKTYAVITVLGNGSGVVIHPMIGMLHDATGSFDGVVWALVAFYVMAVAAIYLIKRKYVASTRP